MNRSVLIWLVSVVGAQLAIVTPVCAHHSFNAYDRTQEQEVAGVVKQWLWVNPHVALTVTVSRDGKEADYVFEGYSPAVLPKRSGMTRDMIKVGDKITVKYFPRKDGVNGGQLDVIVPAAKGQPASGAQ